MKHFYQNNHSNHLVVLFHGTGGNEYQLLPIANALFNGADVLSFEGHHGEGFNRRYFPPLNNGEMDREAFELSVQTIIDAYEALNLSYEKITVIGYSNGANIIVGLLEKAFNVDRAILLHPSDLNYDVSHGKKDTHIIITAGANDYMVPAGQAKQLEQQFKETFEHVDFILLDGGHEFSQKELEAIQQYI